MIKMRHPMKTLMRGATLLALLFAGLGNADAGPTQPVKTFKVTSTVAGPPTAVGTLTWAVYQANYQGGDINNISFNIPGSGELEITLSEPLYIARPTVVDATTQPGYSGQPLIRINCNGFASGF